MITEFYVALATWQSTFTQLPYLILWSQSTISRGGLSTFQTWERVKWLPKVTKLLIVSQDSNPDFKTLKYLICLYSSIFVHLFTEQNFISLLCDRLWTGSWIYKNEWHLVVFRELCLMGEPDVYRGPVGMWRRTPGGLQVRARVVDSTKSQRENSNPIGRYNGKEHPRFGEGFSLFLCKNLLWQSRKTSGSFLKIMFLNT